MSFSPLPLAAWLDDGRARTSWVWDQWSGQRLIFWSFALSAPLLRQLVEQNAEVSLVRPPATESLTQFLCHAPVRDLLDRVQRHAKPWPEVLEKRLLSDDPKVNDVLAEYRLAGGDVDALLDKLPRRSRQLAEESLFPGGGARRVVTAWKADIIEADDDWHEQSHNGQNRLICDAVLRIDKIVTGNERRGVLYAGRILYQGREVQYCELRKVIEKNPLNWMRDRLLEEKLGFLAFDPKFNRQLIQIAAQFHKPEFHDCLPRIGWDRDEQTFVLPRTVIRDGGEFSETDQLWSPEDLPGINLAQPDACFPSQVADAVQDSPAYRAFWAVFAVLTANVVGPARSPSVRLGAGRTRGSSDGRGRGAALRLRVDLALRYDDRPGGVPRLAAIRSGQAAAAETVGSLAKFGV